MTRAREERTVPGPLTRAIGFWQLFALTVNCVVGAGILGLPGRVYGLAGAWTGWVLLAAAVLATAVALCLAELAGRFDETGGPVLYLEAAFGPGAGFVAGWLLWTATVLGGAALLNLLAEIVAPGGARVTVVVAIGIVLTVVTAAGAGRSATVSAGLAGLKLLLLGGIAVAGLGAAAAAPVRLPATPGDAPAALMLLFFAFVGFERATAVAGEVRDPHRTLPLALVASMAAVSLLYAGLFAACLRLVPALAISGRPVTDVALALFGPAAARLIGWATAAIVLGTLASQWITGPRVIYALAQAGQLPRPLARLAPGRQTPDVAIAVTAAAAVLLALGGDFIGAAAASSASRLVIFVGCAAALLRLRRSGPAAPFRLPGGGVLAAAVAVTCLALLATARAEFGRLLALTLFGGLLWLATRRLRR